MAMVCEPWIVYCSHQVSASSDNWVLIAGASVWIFEIERILKLSSPDIHIFSEKYIFPIFKNANESPKVRLTGY